MGLRTHRSIHHGTDGVNFDHIGKSGIMHDHEGVKKWDNPDVGRRLYKDSDDDWADSKGRKFRQGDKK